MKKIFVIAIAFYIFSLPLTAKNALPENPHFYLQIISSYNKEAIDYFVIDTNGKTNSKLEWQSDYLFKEGIKAGYKIKQLEVNLKALFALPFECGKMYDSDWRITDIKTNYSKSDLFAKFGADTSLGIKYNFELAGKSASFFISPVLVISNSFISLAAKNTIGWCGDIWHTGLDQHQSWDSPYAKKVKKYGIDFKNNITSIFCGLEGSAFIKDFSINAGLLASPFTYIFSIDHHLNKEEGHYYQLIQKAYFAVWDFYASLGWSLNDKNSIILGTDFSFCPVIPGELYFGYYKIDNIIADETSSFSFNKLAITLSWRIVL